MATILLNPSLRNPFQRVLSRHGQPSVFLGIHFFALFCFVSEEEKKLKHFFVVVVCAPSFLLGTVAAKVSERASLTSLHFFHNFFPHSLSPCSANTRRQQHNTLARAHTFVSSILFAVFRLGGLSGCAQWVPKRKKGEPNKQKSRWWGEIKAKDLFSVSVGAHGWRKCCQLFNYLCKY
jgi:hypothetical protein